MAASYEALAGGWPPPNGANPLVGETVSRAQSPAASYGAPAEDGSPQRRGPIGWGERGTLPTRWSLPVERVQGMATRSGEDQLVGGTRRPAQSMLAAYGARTENGIPQCCRPTSLGYGESRQVDGRCLGCVYGEWRSPNGAGPLARGTGSLAQSVAASYGVPARGWQPPKGRWPMG